MKKEYVTLIAIIILIIILMIILFTNPEIKDIEVNVLDFNYENNQYFVNISLKNNLETTGWISDTFLETVEESIIDLTGAGIDKKVDSGEIIFLQLFSAKVTERITDPPISFKYTVFPSGKIYSVEI